jgi:AraC-like DNA-binding protein
LVRPWQIVDLTPGYRELAPPPELRDVVACLWIRVHGAGDDVRVVPDACSDVVWEQGAGTTVVGPDTSAKVVAGAPGDVLIGMRFRPGAGGGALGVPLDALRDQRVEAAEVDRAFDVAGDLAPADVIGRFLAIVAGREPDALVAEAARRLGASDVQTVARELSISDRQLRRRFHTAVGYGPKTLERVLRFRRFIDAIDDGRADLAALAFDVGYADQAHLTREATRLAGLPPGALFHDRTSVPFKT